MFRSILSQVPTKRHRRERGKKTAMLLHTESRSTSGDCPGLQGPQARSVRLGDLSAGARQAVPQQPCSGAWPAGGQLQREPPACSGVKEPRPSSGGQEAARATQDGQKHGLQRRGNRGACGGTQRCLRATREAELPTAELCGGGSPASR